MESGNPLHNELIALSKKTTMEVHVHLSRRWFEKDPFARASDLYARYASGSALAEQDGILIYLNLRRRKFAIYADRKPLTTFGQGFFEQLGGQLSLALSKEKPETALVHLLRALEAKYPKTP